MIKNSIIPDEQRINPSITKFVNIKYNPITKNDISIIIDINSFFLISINHKSYNLFTFKFDESVFYVCKSLNGDREITTCYPRYFDSFVFADNETFDGGSY